MIYKEVFKINQIRFTQQRKHVFEVLQSADKPMSLDEIQDACPKIDFSSVYRCIKLFVERGIISEHYFGDRKPKYALVLDQSHHHFIKCVNCGEIEELKNICIASTVGQKTDYKILDHYMEFTGICPICSKN